MKKILLSIFVFASFNALSQTILFEDNFNDGDISNWTLIDSDGDGNGWVPVNMTAAPIYMGMRSASWITSGPLTPDNWAITPAIDLGAGGSTVELTWNVVARDAAWDLENYSVYVSNTPTAAGMLATTSVFNEVLGGVNVMTARSVTLPSSLTGTIYVAFRHHGVTDQFTMDIDDVVVTSTPLSTNSFFANNLKVYPNPTKDILNLSSSTTLINSVEVTDLNGRIVKSFNLNGIAQTELNVSDLTSGMYFVSVETDLGKGTTKIVKN